MTDWSRFGTCINITIVDSHLDVTVVWSKVNRHGQMRAQALEYWCWGMVDHSVGEMGWLKSRIEDMQRTGRGACVYVFLHPRPRVRAKYTSMRCTDMVMCSDQSNLWIPDAGFKGSRPWELRLAPGAVLLPNDREWFPWPSISRTTIVLLLGTCLVRKCL